MAETRHVVILGASFGGLGVAHYLAKHVLPKLQQAQGAQYSIELVDPSTHFWWHIAAPREIVDVKSATHSKYFVSIKDGFAQYSNLKINIHQGTATALDKDARTVTITRADGGVETFTYYALVIATGVKSPTPLTTLHGDHTVSQKALEKMNEQLASAKDIIVSGGGPVGVETAGEIAVHVKGKAKVTLIAGGDKLLPVLNASRAQKVQKLLEKSGVTVVYGVKTTGATESADGKTEVQLDNGTSMTADVYIPAYGVVPNTDFLSADLKNEKGYVKTNAKTLRVDGAGVRVYAAGDVAGVDKGGVLNMNNTIPILGNNIAYDLLADAQAGRLTEKSYTFKAAETQLVPVGPKTGVGAFNGFGLPGFAVSMIKGKDYMVARIPDWSHGAAFKKP